jgi:hypothetical protein
MSGRAPTAAIDLRDRPAPIRKSVMVKPIRASIVSVDQTSDGAVM